MPFQQLYSGGAFGYSSDGQNALPQVRVEIPTSYTQTTTISKGMSVTVNATGQAVIAATTDGSNVIGICARDTAPSTSNPGVPVVVFGELQLNATTYIDAGTTAGNVLVQSVTTAGYLTGYTNGSAVITGTTSTARVLGTLISSTATNAKVWVAPKG